MSYWNIFSISFCLKIKNKNFINAFVSVENWELYWNYKWNFFIFQNVSKNESDLQSFKGAETNLGKS